MIAPKHAQLAAVKDVINTYIDRVNDVWFRRRDRGDPMNARARALVAMDKAILDTILFDWQPMETIKPGDTGIAVIVENQKTGVRWMRIANCHEDGVLYDDDGSGQTVDGVLTWAVAWSRMPDSKALGGK